MKRTITYLLLGATLTLACATAALAGVETKLLKSFAIEGVPLSVVMTYDGQSLYVLTDKNEVLIYGSEGGLRDRLKLDEPTDSLLVSPRGDALILGSKEKKSVRIMALDFIRNIPTAGSAFRGPENAPVSVVLFTDFQCPACKQMEPLLDQVMDKAGKDAKLVVKQFPLVSIHPQAMPAAKAALAANEQGKYWEMHRLLFQSGAQLNDAKFKELAKQIGLDMEAFEASLKDPKIQAAIDRDMKDGIDAGVRGTPTIYINGHLVQPQNRSLDGMLRMIQEYKKK
jgi:predicted DsbA family dithiol-disulfide isomerase